MDISRHGPSGELYQRKEARESNLGDWIAHSVLQNRRTKRVLFRRKSCKPSYSFLGVESSEMILPITSPVGIRVRMNTVGLSLQDGVRNKEMRVSC